MTTGGSRTRSPLWTLSTIHQQSSGTAGWGLSSRQAFASGALRLCRTSFGRHVGLSRQSSTLSLGIGLGWRGFYSVPPQALAPNPFGGFAWPDLLPHKPGHSSIPLPGRTVVLRGPPHHHLSRAQIGSSHSQGGAMTTGRNRTGSMGSVALDRAACKRDTASQTPLNSSAALRHPSGVQTSFGPPSPLRSSRRSFPAVTHSPCITRVQEQLPVGPGRGLRVNRLTESATRTRQRDAHI